MSKKTPNDNSNTKGAEKKKDDSALIPTEDAQNEKQPRTNHDKINSKGLSPSEIGEVVDQLLKDLSWDPEKLDKLVHSEEKHNRIYRIINEELTTIKSILYPGKDAISKGLATKISGTERAKLHTESAKLISLKRKLSKSTRLVSTSLIERSKEERKNIRAADLREKVKDPNYYKKYGKFIPKAFDRWIAGPMTRELRYKLEGIKTSSAAKFNDALSKLLLFENISLYIRCTGSKELRPVFFAEFSKSMGKWHPKNVKIKTNYRKESK